MWGYGTPCPLPGTDHLAYLGVPLCYRGSTLGQLGISLSKMSSSFFSLRRLLDHPDTPVGEKLQLFQSYITSKWAWCSPVIYPMVRALKSVEAFKHTLLLSLLRFPTDPLQPPLVNVIARRRAVKVLCEVHKSERWGSVWLSRLWTFWGHVFRSQANLPIQEIMRRGSTHRVVVGRASAGVLKPLIFRKLQLAWGYLRGESYFSNVEALAADREAWLSYMPAWLARWGYSGSVLDAMPPNYLHDRQLLLIGKTQAILRPARVFPEEPYIRELQHIRRGQQGTKAWVVWGRLLTEGACVTLLPPRQSGLKCIHIQVRCQGDLLLRRLCLLEAVQTAWQWTPATLDTQPCCFLPPESFAAHIFNHQVPLQHLWRVHKLDGFELRVDMLQKIALHPKRPEEWLLQQLPETFGPFPTGRDVLVRFADFSQAQFFNELPGRQPL